MLSRNKCQLLESYSKSIRTILSSILTVLHVTKRLYITRSTHVTLPIWIAMVCFLFNKKWAVNWELQELMPSNYGPLKSSILDWQSQKATYVTFGRWNYPIPVIFDVRIQIEVKRGSTITFRPCNRYTGQVQVPCYSSIQVLARRPLRLYLICTATQPNDVCGLSSHWCSIGLCTPERSVWRCCLTSSALSQDWRQSSLSPLIASALIFSWSVANAASSLIISTSMCRLLPPFLEVPLRIG